MNINEINKQFDLYNNMYRALSGVLAGLPCHPELIKNVGHYLDTGFLWVKEGIQGAIAVAQAVAAQEAAKPADGDADDASEPAAPASNDSENADLAGA